MDGNEGIAFSSHPFYAKSSMFNSSSFESKKPLKEISPVFSTIYKSSYITKEGLDNFFLDVGTKIFERDHFLSKLNFSATDNEDILDSWSKGWKRGWTEGFKYGLEKGKEKKKVKVAKLL